MTHPLSDLLLTSNTPLSYQFAARRGTSQSHSSFFEILSDVRFGS